MPAAIPARFFTSDLNFLLSKRLRGWNPDCAARSSATNFFQSYQPQIDVASGQIRGSKHCCVGTIRSMAPHPKRLHFHRRGTGAYRTAGRMGLQKRVPAGPGVDAEGWKDITVSGQFVAAAVRIEKIIAGHEIGAARIRDRCDASTGNHRSIVAMQHGTKPSRSSPNCRRGLRHFDRRFGVGYPVWPIERLPVQAPQDRQVFIAQIPKTPTVARSPRPSSQMGSCLNLRCHCRRR